MNACFLTFIQNKKLKKKSYVRMNMCVCKEREREREREREIYMGSCSSCDG